MTADEIRARLEELREAHNLPAWQDTAELEDVIANVDDDPYILLERGHYSQTAVSSFDSPEAAGAATLNQEYAEDWAPEILWDTIKDKVLIPITIEWRPLEAVRQES